MSHRILVVDDSEGSRYVVATWLRREGYDVLEAATGEEALALAATAGIDLGVLDVNLPDMSGYVVCERLKAGAESSMPVLHVSATAISPSDRSEGLRRGADAYLVEPVDRDVLLASVGALLRGADAERTARRLARRLRRLNDATLALNEARTLEYLAKVVAQQACALFERAAWVAIEVGDVLEYAAFGPDPGNPHDLVELPTCSFDELLSREGGHAFANIGAESDRATLVLGSATDATCSANLSEEDRLVLTQFVRAATTALKNLVVYDIERAIAVTLQQSLLPTVVPEVPNAQLAVRYLASAEHAEVGGDFYEMFALGDRRMALAIGDVVGHSLEAAAIMAQLRTGIRSYMLEGHNPSSTILRLNAMLQRFHPETSATVCCATYDWETGECEIANAGHPPALFVTGTTSRYLPFGGTLLGVTPVHGEPTVLTLEPGDLVLFYTDGLIERRREGIDAGFERLAQAAAFPSDDLEAFLDHVLAEVAPAKPGDDIAIVALRRSHW
jgi:CheY-like chemotaxis protein